MKEIYVFIDTSVFEKNAFFKESGIVYQLFELAKQGYLKIIIPAITKNEWKNHYFKRSIGDIYSFEREISFIGNVLNKEALINKYKDFMDNVNNIRLSNFDLYMSYNGLIFLDYDYFNDLISSVFDRYFNKEKPFGSRGKNKEFPDAFVLAALDKYAEENNLDKIIVLSEDNDMKDYNSKYLEIGNGSKLVSEILLRKTHDNETKIKIKFLFNYVKNDVDFKRQLETQVLEYLSNETRFMSRFNYNEIDDINIDNIDIYLTNKDADVRIVKDCGVMIVCFPEIDINMSVNYYDEELSIWDSEEKEYIYRPKSTSQFEISSYLKVDVLLNNDCDKTELSDNVEIIDINFESVQKEIDDYH